MHTDITCIDLFDQNVGMACAKVRIRCSWILLVLIYLIKMWVWHVSKSKTQIFLNIIDMDLFDQSCGYGIC